MAQRVNLDTMIRREDFAREIKEASAPAIIRELKLSDLLPTAAIRRQLRKPEFQRETNHWTVEQVLRLLTSKIYDLTATPRSSAFSDDTKSQIYYRQAIEKAQVCPICYGLLDIAKSVSYDHITPVRDGGLGTAENGQMVHPYCNTGVKG